MVVSLGQHIMVPEDHPVKSRRIGIRDKSASPILLPQDISLIENLYLSMMYNEKIRLSKNIFNVEESLRKQSDVIHNKYYVVNPNLQLVVYHSF